MMPHQLLADGLAQRVDRGVDTCINGHGQVLHLEGNVSVVAHHVANREEFLPPLEILAAADCNVVPYAVSGLGNRTRLQNAVGVSQTALDTGILAVNVEDAALECACSRDRSAPITIMWDGSRLMPSIGSVASRSLSRVEADQTMVPGNSSIATCSIPHFLQCAMNSFQNSIVTFHWYS